MPDKAAWKAVGVGIVLGIVVGLVLVFLVVERGGGIDEVAADTVELKRRVAEDAEAAARARLDSALAVRDEREDSLAAEIDAALAAVPELVEPARVQASNVREAMDAALLCTPTDEPNWCEILDAAVDGYETAIDTLTSVVEAKDEIIAAKDSTIFDLRLVVTLGDSTQAALRVERDFWKATAERLDRKDLRIFGFDLDATCGPGVGATWGTKGPDAAIVFGCVVGV